MAGRPAIHDTMDRRYPVDLAALLRKARPWGSNISGSIVWSRAGRSVLWRLTDVDLTLSYSYLDGHVDDRIPLEYTATAFRGRRPWLRCTGCGGRCRVVYRGFGGYRCRRCYGLTYQSQREDAASRAQSRAQSIRARLGGSGDMQIPFPPKPKGMHWRTYSQLAMKDVALNEAWAAGMTAKFGLCWLS